MEKESQVWEGGSGKLFNKVYYKRNGKTFARKAPGSYISAYSKAVSEYMRK